MSQATRYQPTRTVASGGFRLARGGQCVRNAGLGVAGEGELRVIAFAFHVHHQGVLTGKYAPGQPAPAASRLTGEDGKLKSDNRYLTDDILTRVQQLKPLAAGAGLSMPALAVAWVLQNPNVSAAIVGASRPDQLIDTASAVGVKLDPALLAQVDHIMEPVIERNPAKVESFPARP